MTFRISTIVPHFNHNAFLKSAVRSAVEQTLSPCEIIVIDDGSEIPVALETLGNVADMAPEIRVVVIQQRHQGIGAALNAGIRQMTGDVFTWLPADDLWKNRKLETQAAGARRLPDCIRHSWCEIWEGNTFVRRGEVPEYDDAGFAEAIRTSSPYFGNTFWIPKSILDQVGGFREDVPACEDYEWVLRSVVRHGVRYRLQREVLTVKRHHPGQTTVRCQSQIPELVRQFNAELDSAND